MQFRPFVYDAMNQQVPVAIEPMTPQDAAVADGLDQRVYLKRQI